MRKLAVFIGLVAAIQIAAPSAQSATALADVLQRAGERVERFFTRAQSIVCLEIVHLQALTSTWGSDGPARTVESELRLSWDADAQGANEAQTLRRLLKVNGRPPRENDWNGCTAPEQQAQEPQPLSMLLPARRGEYDFTWAGEGRFGGRPAVMIDYRARAEVSVDSWMVEGRDDCVSFDLDGGLRGRLWIDAETFDVLRMDQRLIGMVEVPLPKAALRWPGRQSTWTMERWDTSIRFRAVTFKDPEETLVLPESLSSVRVTRGSGTPRLRTITQYRNYQRFLTGARVIGD